MVAGWYRVTLNGLRASRRLKNGAYDAEEEAEGQAEESGRERRPRARRKSKPAEPSVQGLAPDHAHVPEYGATAVPVKAAEAA